MDSCMRLTLVLLGASRRRPGGARGCKTRGKHQEPHIIQEPERRAFVENLVQECTNEMWLTRPYLNEAQEKCLTEQLVKTSKGNPLKREDTKLTFAYRNMKYRINMPQHVSFEQRWSHLKSGNQWVQEDKERYRKKELERFARAVIPKRYPDFYPRYEEKWDEWNKIEGFGRDNANFSTLVKKEQVD